MLFLMQLVFVSIIFIGILAGFLALCYMIFDTIRIILKLK